MAKISDKIRRRIFERDGGRCPHCGETEAIGLQHRISKGMGGSKLLDTPANLLTFCNIGNAGMESDPELAEKARRNGWKLSRWEDPANVPFYDTNTGRWWLTDSDYGRQIFLGGDAPYGTK